MIRKPLLYLLILFVLSIPFFVFSDDALPEEPEYSFNLISPVNDAFDISTSVSLMWQFVEHPALEMYQLEIHRSSTDEDTWIGDAWVPIQTNVVDICSAQSGECEIGVLGFANTISIDAGAYAYEWRVIAQDESGDGIGSSQSWGFTTVQLPDSIAPPPPPTPGPGEDPDPGPGPVTPPVVGIFQFENPISSNTFPELITKLLNLIFGLSIVITPLVILYAGFLMLTAAGDAAKLQKARSILIWTVIAFAIILVAKGAPNVIQSIL